MADPQEDSMFEKARALVDAATEGPWTPRDAEHDCYNTASVYATGAFVVADCPDGGMPDAEFIAMARNLFPAMLDVIEAAEVVAGPGFDIANNLRLQESLTRVRQLLDTGT
jgi:hypothetical protein